MIDHPGFYISAETSPDEYNYRTVDTAKVRGSERNRLSHLAGSPTLREAYQGKVSSESLSVHSTQTRLHGTSEWDIKGEMHLGI